ncbi:hypothetical protein BS17DRAFT_823487 [Gyrodon lividus]|nr:hypothetical protein BS17DRAFT_823487 [Gyrodon lividus]
MSSRIAHDMSGNHQLPDQEETKLFQQRYFVDPQSPDSSQPMGFIAFHQQHYFTVIFHYDAAIAYVLGRRIGEDCDKFDETLDDWETWMGPLYWARIAALHGFDAGDPRQVSVVTHNWPQNGRDCGPIACFLLKHFMDHGVGIAVGDLHFPPIPCGHELRWRMLGAVREACRSSWEDYNLLTSSRLPPHDIWTVWDDTRFITDHNLTAIEHEASGQQYTPVVQDLNITSTNCSVCQKALWADEAAGDDPSDILANDEPPRDVDEDQTPS